MEDRLAWAAENYVVPEDPFNPEDEVNIHSLTMEELRHEAARILSLYHNASDANEMLSLSTRYTKIDMLLDKREKLIAQGVPMSEIIERTSPPKPSTPPPPIPETSRADTDPAAFDTPVDDSEFAPFDEEPLPEVKEESVATPEVIEASESEESPPAEEPAKEISALDTPTMEMNVDDLMKPDESDSIHDDDTQKLSVEEISKFEPADEEENSKPLSVPDINLESDSDLDSFTDAPALNTEAADPSDMPTPIMPLNPVQESEVELPTPAIPVNDVDLDTPVPDDVDESEDSGFTADDDDGNTTIIMRKKKQKADFGVAAVTDDVGFSDVGEDADEPDTEEPISESAEEEDSGDDSDSNTVIMRKKKFSFLAGLDDDSNKDVSVTDAAAAVEPSTEDSAATAETEAPLEPDAPDETVETVEDTPEPASALPPLSEVPLETPESVEESTSEEPSELLPAFEMPSGAFEDTNSDAPKTNEETPGSAFNFDTEPETGNSAEDTYDSDGEDEAEALGVLTTPFEATDAEMESFGFNADDDTSAKSEPAEEKIPEESTSEIGATDAEESKDSELSDFEKALASLNAAIDESSKFGKEETPKESQDEPADNASSLSASEGEDVTAQINATEGAPMVESVFDIDAASKSEAAPASTSEENQDEAESVFNFEVDTQIPVEEMGGEAPPVAFADLMGDSEESPAEESAEPAEEAQKPKEDEASGGIGNLPSLGDAVFGGTSDADDTEQPAESTPVEEPAAVQEEAPAEEAKEEAAGLPAFELPPFDPDGLAGDSKTEEPAGAGLNLPPIGEIPSLGSDATPGEEPKPVAPSPASSAPTTPAPIPPVGNIPPQSDENAAKLQLKGHLRICTSCGEQTEITESRCQKCFYLDNSLGIVNAVMAGDTSQVTKLLRVKPDILHTRTKKHNWTLLHMAASGGNMRLTKLLVEKGCAVNEPNVYGKTALHYAASKGHAPIVYMLLQAGADASMKFDNKTALQLAMENGRTEAIAALQDA